ncbi:caspase-8-like [Synchiropus splendidus]|uniref:caspase-8-like n=1 Tax=Synchiropus splendidus TaxID=270530 RepID=UPI00237DDED7|nr:caspase-8-like [Synchiropus splendidus]XP_053740218.1 caspase-8-like [Synchiropus splendidus]
MSARDILRCKKIAIEGTLSSDHSLILNKVHERNLITQREYNNLRCISGGTVSEHITALLDKIMNKGEETAQAFLSLLQTDEDIRSTFPQLKSIGMTDLSRRRLRDSCTDQLEQKRPKMEELYPLNSSPVGLCLIINNKNFLSCSPRHGTDRDAQCLGEVFTSLGFRVLMCEDQTTEQMDRCLKCFGSFCDPAQLQGLDLMEFSGGGFTALQDVPKHGDAFFCCILSHGDKGVVLGVDSKPLAIKDITNTFMSSPHSQLTGKPKVFLIQACQGRLMQRGVLLADLLEDSCETSIPEKTDFLVAMATVEDYAALRHRVEGSWFIQTLCQELMAGSQRADDFLSILLRVINGVSRKEGSSQVGAVKQVPEVRFTLRKSLVLKPHEN